MRLVWFRKINIRFSKYIFVRMKSPSHKTYYPIGEQVVIIWSQIWGVVGCWTTLKYNSINFATTTADNYIQQSLSSANCWGWQAAVFESAKKIEISDSISLLLQASWFRKVCAGGFLIFWPLIKNWIIYRCVTVSWLNFRKRDSFPNHIITINETYVHHSAPKSKQPRNGERKESPGPI